MDFFFEPKGVAVVGATLEKSGGHSLIANVAVSYKGPVYPVNPRYKEILGLKCYSRISDINGPLDLALIFIPAQGVPQVLEDCVIKGVRGAMLEMSGFAEIGPEGKALQDQCLTIARKSGLRIWGPNCMGLIDASKGYVFSFIATEAWQGVMNPGHVSLIVQSGLLAGGFITTLMGNKTLGLAKVCSIGNKSDVEETELLEYLLKDPATKVIGVYLESFIYGRRFFELCATSDKPIVLLKGGKSPSGAEASASHTASLAGNDELIRGALNQAGVHQADDFFEMVDIARTLEKDFHLQQPTEKPRIAILSYSGAAGIVTTDHMEAHGLTLARLSTKTQKRLEELSPVWMPVKNPVDFWPAIEKHGTAMPYKIGMEALHDDPEVDAIIVHLFAGFGIWSLDVKEAMSGIKKPRKPILFWLMGPGEGEEITRLALEEEGLPVFNEIHRTVRVMANIFEHRRHEKKRLEMPSLEFPIPNLLRDLARQAAEKGVHMLDEHESKKWLQALGLKVVKEVIVQNVEEAIRAADELGYPVVLKGRVEGHIHKTEAGLVKLNLWTAHLVRSAYEEMLCFKKKPRSFLIQPMLKGGLELIIGIIRDPQFGPSVMLGLGGVQAEIYRDVAFRVVPLNENEVFNMVSELKGRALFTGFRGSKPVNMKALTDWLIRLGWLAMNYERIQEIDVNPLLIVDGEPVAVDATIIFKKIFKQIEQQFGTKSHFQP
jgi:acetyltransferase